jgi:riboflavin kinase / FMN adenylyltransferase
LCKAQLAKVAYQNKYRLFLFILQANKKIELQVHHNIFHLPSFKNAVITIGTFDGVHKGHQSILHQLVNQAKQLNGESIIITFFPHPRSVVRQNEQPLLLLNTLDERIELLTQYGIDHLVIVPFDAAFAELSANEYVDDFLVKYFQPKAIIIGYDHHFGKNRTGDHLLLSKKGMEHQFALLEIPKHVLQEVAVSSTQIRQAIAAQKIETANALLGYPYFFSGQVVEGNQMGRTIGYPTANLHLLDETKLIPGDAVYAVQVKVNEESTIYNAMMNIGYRPTVAGKSRTIEVHIFNFDADIYGKMLRVNVHAHLRNEIKFAGLDALTMQLAEDKEKAMQYFL